ncbi:MAG: MaoC family dehydratase [Vulcanimicrobiaceae bacterium]
MDKYWEEFNVGDEIVSGGVTVTESAIIDFALKYDPQRFHINVDAARESPYGGLIASGFHTLALGFRMFFDAGGIGDKGLGSPGIDELRWTQPVRPNDVLHTKVVIRGKRESKSRPDRGLIDLEYTVYNQRNEVVLTMKSVGFVLRKPPIKK